MKVEEIFHIAIIYTLFILFVDYGLEKMENKQLEKKLVIANEKMYEAKVITIEIDDEKNNLYKTVDELQKKLDKTEELKKMVDELEKIPRNMQNLILGSCYDESRLKRDVFHPGKYDKTTVGICGVKKEWIGVIPELTEENINSLYAGYLVLDHLIKEKGSKVKGLAAYKGSIKNYKPVHFTLKLEAILNKINI